ncbi:MAG: SDR family oxidoreductase [Myxococcales bacterium]|nr:SDR family oxidoreductase [Myxococcales bacterium]
MPDLSGRVALITGASSGIGAATEGLLVDQGAKVYSADMAVPDPPGQSIGLRPGGGIASLRLDVRDESNWEGGIAHVLEREGRLDILVHSAGISSASPLPETTLAEWRRVLATNLDGGFLAIKHGVRAMTPDGGAIVVVGSASGIRPSAGAAAYSTSKAALSMLARTAAKECRDVGLPVRINVVSPGGVKTPMWRQMAFFQDLVREHGSEDAAFAELEAAGGGRFADPVDIARSILFLVSDAANDITGAELPVDFGYTL